jgi:uncharacterized protein (DUF2141 family)
MKSSLINSIGEVVTDYGARVMKVFKKGLLGRSLFDFYGDIKADALRTNESSAAPGTPADGKGGVIYTKSADGKLYYKSNEVSEIELSANGGHTDEDIQDLVGAMVTSNTESGITVAYQDGDGTLDFTVGTLNQDTTGNAATATALETARAINGVDFNGTAPITVTAAGSTLSDTVPVSKGGTGATSLASTSILTGNGTSAITAQSKLTYSGEILSIGESDAGEASITRNNGAATNGGDFSIQSGRATGGTNLTGGNLKLRSGQGTGNGASGDIIFEAGVPQGSGTGVQPNAEIATLDSTGNLSIDGDLTVKGNDIKDDDGTVCITFDSSGNTTVTNTLNASVTGNVTGNTSGSSGSCTGNAATATALAAGNQTIDGDVTIGANDEGHDLLVYGHTASANMFWNASNDFLKFSDAAKLVFGSGVAAADFDSSIQANGSNLVIYNDTGNIQIGDTVEITGDLTVSGDLSIGNDAEITSVGSMVFRIDSDANESSQTFTWKDNASDTIAALDENGEFTVYGGALGDPHITLHQTGQNVIYGPPLLDFYREDTLVDNADIGMVRFIAKDSADNDQTYAQIVGSSEESGSTTEGGKIKLQVATHDGEMQTGITIEDGDAEDEIDVTIANGSSSLTTVAGNLNITTNIELGHASDTTIARTAAGTASIEGKEIVTINKQKNIHSYAYHYSGTSAHFIPMSGATTSDSTGLTATSYHLMQVMPFDGRVVRIAVFNQTTTSRTDLFEMYIDGDDSDPVADQRGTDLSFTSTQKGNGDCNTDWTFSKGEAIAIRRTPSAAVNGTTITVVFEFDMTT